MKKYFLFYLIINGFVFFLSCQKDDPLTYPSLNSNRVLVKEIIYLDDKSVPYDTMKYSYTSNNLISEIANCRSGSNFTVTFDYENSILTYNPYNEILTENFKLNKNGTLAKYNLFENSFELKYDSKGYLKSANGYDRETSPREFSYEYKNGNLVKITDQLSGESNTFIEYSTISNKSNFTSIEENQLLRGQYFLGMTGVINKNLAKRVIYENHDTLNYDYEMNADSLVTKVLINGLVSSILKY
jgi:hypothetical protein